MHAHQYEVNLFGGQTYLGYAHFLAESHVIFRQTPVADQTFNLILVQLHARITATEEEFHLAIVCLVQLFQLIPMLPERTEWSDARTRSNHYNGNISLLGQTEIGGVSYETTNGCPNGNLIQKVGANTVMGCIGCCLVLNYGHGQVDATGRMAQRRRGNGIITWLQQRKLRQNQLDWQPK